MKLPLNEASVQRRTSALVELVDKNLLGYYTLFCLSFATSFKDDMLNSTRKESKDLSAIDADDDESNTQNLFLDFCEQFDLVFDKEQFKSLAMHLQKQSDLVSPSKYEKHIRILKGFLIACAILCTASFLLALGLGVAVTVLSAIGTGGTLLPAAIGGGMFLALFVSIPPLLLGLIFGKVINWKRASMANEDSQNRRCFENNANFFFSRESGPTLVDGKTSLSDELKGIIRPLEMKEKGSKIDVDIDEDTRGIPQQAASGLQPEYSQTPGVGLSPESAYLNLD